MLQLSGPAGQRASERGAEWGIQDIQAPIFQIFEKCFRIFRKVSRLRQNFEQGRKSIEICVAARFFGAKFKEIYFMIEKRRRELEEHLNKQT